MTPLSIAGALPQFVQDVRYAARGMRRSPAFAAVAVPTLAVGIAVVTIAFTVINAYFLRPYAVRDPDGLHLIAWRSRDAAGQSFRWRDYLQLRERQDVFLTLVAETTRFVSSSGRPLAAALVSDTYFDGLGPRLALGRGLAAIDASAPVVVLGDHGWARLFDRDPTVLGRTLDVNGRAFVVVGVVGSEFGGLDDWPHDAFILLPTYAALVNPALTGPEQPRTVEIFGRLRPGATASHAQEAIAPMVADAIGTNDDVRPEVRPQSSANPLSVQWVAVLAPVAAAFALVLLAACANVSNIMLARAVARHREIAVRLSLGASRGRLVRQLLTEGLLVSVLAGLAAIVLAALALRGAMALLFSTLPPSAAALLRVVPFEIDARVFLFALAVAGATTLVFGLVPALQASRVTLTEALRAQGGDVRRGSRLRRALVIAQVAVALVLVIVALTLARNGAAVGRIDLGYDTAGVISVNVRGQHPGVVRRLAEILASEAAVAQVAVTNGNPLFVQSRDAAVAPAGASAATPTRYTFVSPQYFPLLRLPIVRGRGFTVEEARSAARVAIVSAATAKAFWPGEDPIGKSIRIEPAGGRPVDDLPGYAQVSVIGVTRDAVSGLLLTGRDPGHIYLPMDERHAQAAALLLRGHSPRDLRPDALQRIFERAASDPQVFEALPLEEMRALQAYPLLAASWIGSLLGAIALALGVSGLYGVLMYMLSQRTREIGIRMALGAPARAVIGLMMRQSAMLGGIGAAIGLVVAFAGLKILDAGIRLDTIAVLDLRAFVFGAALVIAVATAAAWHPARRATRVDPAVTLRADG